VKRRETRRHSPASAARGASPEGLRAGSLSFAGRRQAVSVCLVLLLAAGAVSLAGAAARIEVERPAPLAAVDVIAFLEPAAEKPDSLGVLSAVVDALLTRYAEAGHPFARIDAGFEGSRDGPTLRAIIDAGPPASIGAVRFTGNASFARKELLRITGLRAGAPLTAADTREAADAVVSAYENAGRPLAAVVPSVSLGGTGLFDVEFAIDEGRAVVFGEAVIVGNEATREDVALREAAIPPGEPFSRDALARARGRLERSGLFSAVSAPSIAYEATRSEAIPVFEVQEARNSRILGALGYVPGDDRLSGAVEVVLGNIAGTGRKAEASWERLSTDERRASFSYTEPWLFGAPIDLGVAGSQTVRDTLSTVTEGDLVVTARMGERSRVSWSLGAERYVPGAADESPTGSARTALAATYDATDSAWNPSRGLWLAASLEYSAKEVDDSNERERASTARAEVRAYLPMTARQTVALRGTGAGVWSSEDDVPFHEELPLGGATSLRGYREEQFRGVRVVSGSVEYRYLIGRSSRLLAFLDIGHFRRDGSNPATDTKLGYGIGLRGATRLGIIAVDYGLGEGNSLLDGKLHVGFTRAF